MSLSLVLNDFVGDAAFADFDQTEPIRKHFEWKTDLVEYDNMIQQRNKIMTRPRRHWFVNWTVLDLAARNKLKEIFHAAAGQYDTFLWLDSDDFLASAQTIATDGSATTYQLAATYYSGETYEWSEDKKDIVPGGTYQPVVTHNIDGAQTEVQVNPPNNADEYYLDDTTGIMTWKAASPPSVGVLTCTFQYYFRVQFAMDILEDNLIYPAPIYRPGELHLIEVLPTS